MALKYITANLAAFGRLLIPAGFSGRRFDGSYAAAAERHARKPESREEQALIIEWLRAGGYGPERILDVGCNTGVPLDAFCRAFACDGAGIDVNDEAVAKATLDWPTRTFLAYAGLNIPFEDRSFDHVMLHHVIGHVEDPRNTIREIARVLRPRCTLSIVTTNAWYQFWQTPLNIFNRFVPDSTVLRYYSAATLKKLLAANGFEVLRSCTWNPSDFERLRMQNRFCRLRLICLAVRAEER